MINNIVNNIRGINKGLLLDNFKLDNTSKRVKKLKKIEARIKADYKINTEVVYVDAKHKTLFHKESIRGVYISSQDKAIVYLNSDYVANVTTLCHELTHAYQAKYQTTAYKKSRKDLKAGKTTYKTAWHEVNAKEQASLMYDYYCVTTRALA